MKKFDNFISNLEILQKAENEDLKKYFHKFNEFSVKVGKAEYI